MTQAARQYGQIAQSAMSPRDLEANALLKAAARLQSVTEREAPGAFDEALDYNRRLWTLFAGTLSDPASPLPEDLRARVLALAEYVFNHTIQLQGRQDVEGLSVLVRINRELAAGLRGT